MENLAVIIRPEIHKVKINKGKFKLSEKIKLFHNKASGLKGIVVGKDIIVKKNNEVEATTQSFFELIAGRKSRKPEAKIIFNICLLL